MKKIAHTALICLALAAGATQAARAADDPPKAWQDVRALVVRFNDAQNAHNLDVIGALLVDSPDFVWSVGPTQERGRDAALNQLAQMYQTATWSVLPDYADLNIRMDSSDAADISLPVQYKTSTALQDTTMPAIVHERAVRTPQGWRLASVVVQPQPSAML